VYLCPQGKELSCHARNQTNRYRTYDVYHARPEDCAACSLKAQCLSKPTTSRRYLSIPVDTHELNLIDEMKARIDSEQGKRIACPGFSVPGTPGDLGSWNRSFLTSVCRSTCTASRYGPS
jgi:hypothetical protein